jgi:hypothetical protein
MGEAGSLEVLVECRVDASCVADDEPRQQPRRPGGQDSSGRRDESCAHALRGLLEHSGPAEQRGRAPDGHDGEHVIARPGRGQPPPDTERSSRGDVPPLDGRGEEEHVGVQSVGLRPIGQDGDVGVCDHPLPASPRQLVRVAEQFELEVDRAAGRCGGAQRRGLPGGLPDGGRRESDRQAGENCQRHGRRRPDRSARHDGSQTGRRQGTQRQLCRGEQRRAGADAPDGRGNRREPQVHPCPAAGRRAVGPGARGRFHTATIRASSAAMAGPIPGTSSS